MNIIRERAYARAGLIGNPSDGYGGRTISIVLPRYYAEVVLYEWEDMEIILSQEDRCRFGSVQELVRDVQLHGYYGGIRLIKATIKRFVEHCAAAGLPLHDRNFSIRYESNIPRQVGLAGSSAISVATLRALMKFYDVQLPEHVQPSLVLSVENSELNIPAGLQDRVVQVYGGLVAMDFAPQFRQVEQGLEYYRYERLDERRLPPLYVAFSTQASEPTEVLHRPLRTRFESGDPEVCGAMRRFAELALEFREALERCEGEERFGRISAAMDENFDLRRSILTLAPAQIAMVQRARALGASAKFAGSGGAIVGAYRDEAMFDALQRAFGDGGEVFRVQE